MLRRRRSSRRVLLLVAVTLSLFWMFPSPAPARDYAVGAGPYSVAVGDLNGDGRLDLVVANSLANTVSVLLGNGDGTFQAARNFDAGLGSGPIWVVVVDINGDGKADVLLANEMRHSLVVLLGIGEGTLQPPMNFDTAGNLPESIAVGDFNGDGKLDVAVAHFYSTNVTVLLGNGDGTFQPAYVVATFAPNMNLIPVAVGDLNGDGKLDLVTASVTTTMVAVMLGNGDGTFQPPQITPFVGDPESIMIRDFNGDRKMDLALPNDDSPDAKVAGFLGNGDGTLQPVQRFSVGAMESESLAAGDFNGDGKLDLVFANAGTNNISVLLGNGDGTFRPALTFPVGNRNEFVAIGDFNGDGTLDVAGASYNTNTVGGVMGNGGGTFANLPPAATPVLSPGGGTYISSVVVTLTDSTPGATIYYTTNGNTPTTASAPYTGPVTLTTTQTVKAMAVAPDYAPSAVASATYTIQVATPTFSPPAGTYAQSQSVTLDDTTTGAAIYYTTDGSTPTTSSTLYTGAISVRQSTTLKAMAVKSGMADSLVAAATYTLNFPPAATPVLSPGGGTYSSSVVVTLTDSTSGATIYYTTDASTPTTASAAYAGPLTVTTTQTLKAMAVAPDYTPSAVASATYTIQVATPTFSPPA